MTPLKEQTPAQLTRSAKRVNGREGVPRAHVTEIQRARILGAMGEVAAERGAGAVTVAHVVAWAGVSRRTFYDLFEDREECFLTTLDEAVARAAAPAIEAYEAEGTWRKRVRAGLQALLEFFDEEPALAKLCVVEALAAGPAALEHRRKVVAHLIAAVDEGRSETLRGIDPPPLTADGVVGAVLAVIHGRLSERSRQALTDLLGVLMSMIVLPYQGRGAARGELDKPTPARSKKNGGRRVDPLEGLEMRITYRTVRVLIVIAEHPWANNRQIASAAGIHDQGQVSKLLTRLQHLGLIDNRGDVSMKGSPNAWALTPKGEQVEQAIRMQTGPS